MNLSVRVDQRVKLKESEKRGKYLNLARELKKMWNMIGTLTPIVIGEHGTAAKGLVQNKRTNGDHPNYSIIKIGQNTKKCSGNMLSHKYQ